MSRRRRETSVQAYALKRIEALRKEEGVDIEVRNRHGDAFQEAGDADLYGCVGGRHFELELKRGASESLKALQSYQLRLWAQAGAITGAATTNPEVDDFVERLRSYWQQQQTRS